MFNIFKKKQKDAIGIFLKNVQDGDILMMRDSRCCNLMQLFEYKNETINHITHRPDIEKMKVTQIIEPFMRYNSWEPNIDYVILRANGEIISTKLVKLPNDNINLEYLVKKYIGKNE
jgi:hypothetical protein